MMIGLDKCLIMFCPVAKVEPPNKRLASVNPNFNTGSLMFTNNAVLETFTAKVKSSLMTHCWW